MDPVSYDPSCDEPMMSFYNALISGVPHCDPISSADLGTA